MVAVAALVIATAIHNSVVAVAAWAVVGLGAVWLSRPATVQRPPLRFAVVDVETTGLNSADDRVIEIAVVHTDGKGAIEHTASWLVRPDDGAHGGEAVHHISETDLLDAPLFGAVADEVAAALDGRVFVAHNAPFDWSFLQAEFGRVGHPASTAPRQVVCTLRLAATAGLNPLRLDAVCTQVGVDGPHNAHRAADDAEACARALSPLLDRLGVNDIADIGLPDDAAA